MSSMYVHAFCGIITSYFLFFSVFLFFIFPKATAIPSIGMVFSVIEI